MNIFDFSEYRSYIQQWIREAKQLKKSNVGRLAEVAQVHSTYLSQVLSGSKSLSLEQAGQLSEHFGHTKIEREYFFALVQLDRAGTPFLREYWTEKKQSLEAEKNKLSSRFIAPHELSFEQKAVFYSSWLYVAIWAWTEVGGGQTLAQVAEQFQISPDKADAILSFLTQTKLCRLNNNKYTPGEQHVHVPNESPLVVKHHTNWRMKAIQQMDNREPNEIFFTSPMSLSRQDFDQIRESIAVLIKNTIKNIADSPAEELVCLNIDFFKIFR